MSDSNDAQAKKIVLFVDDNLDTVPEHRVAVEKLGHPTWLCRTLNSAVRYIQHYNDQIVLVVIDLYIPGNQDLLRAYEAKVPKGLNNNHGQLLEEYLKFENKGLDYIYLTAFKDAYTGPNYEIVFSKKPTELDKFVAAVKKIVNQN